MAKQVKKVKVIVLKTITVQSDGPLNKTLKPTNEYSGVELTLAQYKHFDKANAVKAFIDETEYE
jgi:hypothetical protein